MYSLLIASFAAIYETITFALHCPHYLHHITNYYLHVITESFNFYTASRNLTFKKDTHTSTPRQFRKIQDGFLPLLAGERMAVEFDLLNLTAIKSFPLPPDKALDNCAHLECKIGYVYLK